ncbi:Multicopper oxidase [hydrothermal vent metagenome]|uniref:Multicopper oxidase n=1 Tax=hydrothermal vent metagenome TaxID=652676 RepID=A0A3B0WYT2_9ZZZZ
MKLLNVKKSIDLMLDTVMSPNLSDPTKQDLFVQYAPNALSPDFIYKAKNEREKSDENGQCSEEKKFEKYEVFIQQTLHETGLKDENNNKLKTLIWGYGQSEHKDSGANVSWPGKTFEVKSHKKIQVKWKNNLNDEHGRPLPHLLPVDESLHWCYSLRDKIRTLKMDGVPLVPHLHGGHSSPQADGNPEYFEGVTENSRGPRFVDNEYEYDNSQRAGTLWYHDHALGLTRLNVYAGLAGFYIVRDKYDTGKHSNLLGLPAKQYELAYCVQDRMFRDNGDLFFPAMNGDPAWDDFITDEGATPPKSNGPSALAEFFGDHMLVNGKIWPKADVEPRNYRIRFLNGSDSRFMRLQFRAVAAGDTGLSNASAPLIFTTVGTDQGFLEKSSYATTVDFMPGERLDIVFDFSIVPEGSRVIVENILGDSPFNGELPSAMEDLDPMRRTDRIMAFDVVLALNTKIEVYDEDDGDRDHKNNSLSSDRFNKSDFDKKLNSFYPSFPENVSKVRKLGLYEGKDEFGRLMPMLGTAEPVIDMNGKLVNGSMSWVDEITENPKLNDTEIWEIYNATGDAHPIHVHLVNFKILTRQKFNLDSAGVLIEQAIKTNTGAIGKGFYLQNIQISSEKANPVLNSEKGPKDMVICYPGEVTRIKMKFDREGRYVWHCHILSHEDHEMMRAFYVGDVGLLS